MPITNVNTKPRLQVITKKQIDEVRRHFKSDGWRQGMLFEGEFSQCLEDGKIQTRCCITGAFAILQGSLFKSIVSNGVTSHRLCNDLNVALRHWPKGSEYLSQTNRVYSDNKAFDIISFNDSDEATLELVLEFLDYLESCL